jgi:CRP-like cAMP-binding protein
VSNPLIRKLEHGALLTDEDRAVLEAISRVSRRVPTNHDIITEGTRPAAVNLIMGGFACRYKLLPDGQRQITAFLVPGDFCDLHVTLLGEMDHTIGTGWGCDIVEIPRATIDELLQNHPRIARALRWSTLVDEATLRTWLVSMGQRSASKQLAHLVCELLLRLQTVGLADADSFDFPLSQVDLGDTLGLSVVHVNRTLQELRGLNLISWKHKRVHIPDVERLKSFADFEPRYLHLDDCRDLPA